jgi:hypothetical protein
VKISWLNADALHWDRGTPPKPPRHQFDATSVNPHPRRRKARANAAGQVVQLKRRQVFRQTKVDVVERDVSRQLVKATIRKPEPGPHRASTMGQGHRVIDPGAPDGQIGIVDLGEGLPLPGGRVRDRPAVKITPQVQLRGEFGRWQGSQAETVLAAIVVEGQVQILEDQWRRISFGVLPDHRCAVDANAFLGQHPVGSTVVAALPVDRDPRDIEPAVDVAAQVQCGFVEAQQTQPQLQARQ